MQVAVAEVAEGDERGRRAAPRDQRGAGFVEEAGNRRHRHRDVVLDVRRPRAAAPRRCSRAASTARAPGPPLRDASRRRRCRPRSRRRAPPRARGAARRRPRCRRPGPARTRGGRAAGRRSAGRCCASSVERRAPSARSRRGGRRSACFSAPSRSTRRRGESTAAPARDARARRRKELQHGGGDDAERALGADEQLLQVVAGVVLAQAAQAVPARGRRPARPRGPAPARASLP